MLRQFPTMSASSKYRQNVALLADADYVRQVDQLAQADPATRSDFLAFALAEAAKQFGVNCRPDSPTPPNPPWSNDREHRYLPS